ncbi:MAG TPA: hypothetical protein VGM64_08200 [Lacunisphaera sp.]
MNRLPLIILAVLVLGSAGFGLFQLEKVQKLTSDAIAWDGEKSVLQKKIWELQRRIGELERKHAAKAGGSAAADGEAPGRDPQQSGEASRPGQRGRRADGARFETVMANPDFQKLMAVQQKGALDGRYSGLFKQLQLSPADLEKFKNLLVEKQSAVMDVMAAARTEGLSGRDNRDQIKQLVQDAQNEVDSNIKSTLGDAAYAQYQNYEATQPQRAVVSQLEQRLSYSPEPLTDAQSQQLVQILAETTPTKENTGRNGGAGGFATIAGGMGGPNAMFSGSSITSEAVARAQGILTTQQMAALQGLQQEQQATAQLRQQMRASFQNQSPVATTPATSTKIPAK